MPRKIQTSWTKAPAWIHAIGDSHCLNYAYDVRQTEFFPHVLAGLLATQTSRAVAAANFGISGDTSIISVAGGTWTATPGMLTRFACITEKRVPDLAIIYGTTNDYSAIAAGGSFAMAPGATTTTVSSLVTLVNLKAMIDSLVASGCARIVIPGYHLLNWSSGGDVTTGVINTEPDIEVDPGAVFGASTRWAQKQSYDYGIAAYPGKLIWVDLYAAFKTRLEADYPASIGTDAFLHVAASNTHLNVTGQSWVADAICDAVVAEGWDDELAAL